MRVYLFSMAVVVFLFSHTVFTMSPWGGFDSETLKIIAMYNEKDKQKQQEIELKRLNVKAENIKKDSCCKKESSDECIIF